MYNVVLSANGVTRFWTREAAIPIREKFIADFLATDEEILKIDFTRVEIVDYSFASEIVAIPLSRLAIELKGKHIIIAGMNKAVEENVTVALEKAELCALAVDSSNAWKLIGKCSEALSSTFAMIEKLKKTDTPTLAERLGTTIPVLNNRLRILTDLGLVKKEESSAPSGGRQYIYYSII